MLSIRVIGHALFCRKSAFRVLSMCILAYPESLILHINFSDVTYTEDVTLYAHCDATDSFPAAPIKWFIGTRELLRSSQFEISESDLLAVSGQRTAYRTRSSVVFRVHRHFNDLALECRLTRSEDNVILLQRFMAFVFNVRCTSRLQLLL